ncbi:MAG: hypothetical protein R3C24_18955 [Cyanobacteriota/Melainabacteria group bacterium]
MKTIQSRARALFDQMERLPLKKDRAFRQAAPEIVQKAVALIDEMTQYRSWCTILYLSSYLLNSQNSEIETAAIKAVVKLLSALRPSDLLQLDYQYRHGNYYTPRYLQQWDELDKSILKNWKVREMPTELFGLASCHRNGFVREAALDHLSSNLPTVNGCEIPYLLIRTGDWVEEVRTIALNSLDKIVEQQNLAKFLPYLEVVHRMSLRVRDAGLDKRQFLLKRIEEFLKTEEHRKLLLSGLDSKYFKDYLSRRRCLALLEEIPDRSTSLTEAIISHISQDPDITIRFALTRLTENLSPERRMLILKKLAAEGTGIERREALRTLFDLSQDGGKELAFKALLDRSASVRILARWKLRTLTPDIDFRLYYQKTITQDLGRQVKATALIGLSETGTAEDAATIEEYTRSTDRILKKAAIKSLAKLDASKYLDFFVATLAGEDAGLSKEARQALAPRARLLNPEQLAEIASTSPYTHAKRNALFILSKAEKWERFISMINAIGDHDEMIVERAEYLLRQWEKDFHAIWPYSLPDTDQQTRLLQAYIDNKDIMHNSVAEIAKSCLKLCGKEP